MKHPRTALAAILSVVLISLIALADQSSRHGTTKAADNTQVSASVIRLSAGDSLQQALNKAVAGDVIELPAGEIFDGPFVLRNHQGNDWVTIISVDNQHRLPAQGIRVSPANAPAMAILTSASAAVISTDEGAAWYHFIGVEIRPRDTGSWRRINSLVELGAGNNDIDAMPHHIVFERSYLHGDPVNGTRRGIVLNGGHLAVIDSYLSGFKSHEDAQAVVSWEGTGPLMIRNNFLEASGENVMIGGADPDIDGRVPSDILIAGNHFSKPLVWWQDHPEHDGSDWTVKNLLELKNARRVLIDGNLFEHNWPQSQNGFSILFTVRNQDGGSPWSVVEHVVFSNNIVRHVGAGISILGHDDNHRSQRTNALRISNNLFYDVGGRWGGGRLFQLLQSPADIEIANNTAIQTDAIMWLEGEPAPGITIRKNILMHNSVGFSGTNQAPGQQSISAYFSPPFLIEDNILIGAGDTLYNSGMSHVTDLSALQFINPDAGDFRRPSAGDGAGVNIAQLCAALSVTERPLYC